VGKRRRAKNPGGGRKRRLRVVVRIVPPGTLRPNPLNPFRKETPDERREGMLRSVGAGLLRVLRRKAETVDTERPASSPGSAMNATKRKR